MPPPPVSLLPRVEDRLSFIYAEHCVVHRDQNAMTLRNEQGVVHVPVTMMSVVLLGPGTTVTHQAMMLFGQCGTSTVWTGERGVRVYASGRSLARSNRMLKAQARKSSIRQERLAVARAMYARRFPGEDVSGLSMQELRGREGARVRRIYRENSQRTGVRWERRDYKPDDFFDSDPINQALSAANTALYGMVHAALIGLGCSPGLGIVHDGHDLCFVYDVADLYKAETTIPIAFETVAEDEGDVANTVRRRMRDIVFEKHILERTVVDVQELLGVKRESEDFVDADVVSLWDYQRGKMAGGTNYSLDF